MPMMVNLIVRRRFAVTSVWGSRDLVTSRDSPRDVMAVTSQFDAIVLVTTGIPHDVRESNVEQQV